MTDVWAASWASLMFSLTLVVRIGAVGSRVGFRLRKFSNGQPLVQVRLEAQHGQSYLLIFASHPYENSFASN